MNLTDEQVMEFQKICAKNDIELTMDEAREEATNLLNLYELLATPLPSEIAEHENEMRLTKEAEQASAPREDDPPTTPPLF